MVLDGPEFFLVISVSVQVITLNVFSIRYFRYADFHRDQKNRVSFVSYCKWLKDILSLTLPSLHLLYLLQGIGWPSIFFCNHSQLFFFILFITFVTLIFSLTFCAC